MCPASGEAWQWYEVQPERPCVELVRELLADVDQAAADVFADPWRAVHHGGVDPVEVDRVRDACRR